MTGDKSSHISATPNVAPFSISITFQPGTYQNNEGNPLLPGDRICKRERIQLHSSNAGQIFEEKVGGKKKTVFCSPAAQGFRKVKLRKSHFPAKHPPDVGKVWSVLQSAFDWSTGFQAVRGRQLWEAVGKASKSSLRSLGTSSTRNFTVPEAPRSINRTTTSDDHNLFPTYPSSTAISTGKLRQEILIFYLAPDRAFWHHGGPILLLSDDFLPQVCQPPRPSHLFVRLLL